MGRYIRKEIQFIYFSYIPPFGIRFELCKIPMGFLHKPQYWWLFALQTDSITSYITVSFLGLIIDWKRKP